MQFTKEYLKTFQEESLKKFAEESKFRHIRATLEHEIPWTFIKLYGNFGEYFGAIFREMSRISTKICLRISLGVSK